MTTPADHFTETEWGELLDGRLSEERARHVDGCEECRTLLSGLEDVAKGSRTFFAQPPAVAAARGPLRAPWIATSAVMALLAAFFGVRLSQAEAALMSSGAVIAELRYQMESAASSPAGRDLPVASVSGLEGRKPRLLDRTDPDVPPLHVALVRGVTDSVGFRSERLIAASFDRDSAWYVRVARSIKGFFAPGIPPGYVSAAECFGGRGTDFAAKLRTWDAMTLSPDDFGLKVKSGEPVHREPDLHQ